MIKRTRDQSYVSFYFAAFFIVWSVREVWFVQYMEKLDPASAAILSAIIKFSIWVLPVFLLIRMAEKKNPFYYLGLLSNVGKGIKWGILISFGLAVYFVVENAFIIDNGADFNLRLHDWLNTIILVGFIEEIVFRGFLLRKYLELFTFWKANIVTSLLFVLIHFPIWLYKDMIGLFPIAISFIIGISFGFIYKKTRSLWSVIIIHSVYNFFVSIF